MSVLNKKSNGFTIIEMIVVLAIIAVMGATLLADYRRGARTNSLRNSAEEMVAALRQTQASAFSGSVYLGAPASDYRLSIDTALNSSYKICVSSEECATNIIETVEISSDVYIADIVIEDTPPIEPDKVQVIFVPPYGDIQFKGTGFSNEQSLTLGVNLMNYNGGSLWVKINPVSGRITYE